MFFLSSAWTTNSMLAPSAHDPERWKPVFRKDHAPPKCLGGHRTRYAPHEIDEGLGDLRLIGRPFLERNQRHVLILDRQLMQLAAGNELLRGAAARRIVGIVV